MEHIAIYPGLLFSSFIKVITQCIKLYFSNKVYDFLAMENVVVSWNLNKPIVACIGVQ
jgi:hypothetical protein